MKSDTLELRGIGLIIELVELVVIVVIEVYKCNSGHLSAAAPCGRQLCKERLEFRSKRACGSRLNRHFQLSPPMRLLRTFKRSPQCLRA
jgi:hypothetical protein